MKKLSVKQKLRAMEVSLLMTAQTGVETPVDLVEKMMFEDWSPEDLTLEHAARLACPDYHPFSSSREELRAALKQGQEQHQSNAMS